MDSPLEAGLRYLDSHFDAALEDLGALAAIPSVSSEKGDRSAMQAAAVWLASRLRKAALGRVEVFATDGNPIVTAEHPGMGTAPSVLIYGHYDVHSPEPRQAWDTPPFAATRRGDRLFARGASDMKGQLIACILAMEAVLAGGTYPATLKILLEGNEEFGPSPVGEFIRAHQELLGCDFCFSADAGMIGEGSPTITYGMRGRCNCVIRVSGPSRDVHDGVFGGVILNPIHVLSQLIAGLHDSDGRVAIPGFYDKVRPIEDAEREELARLPKDDEYFRDNSGAPGLWGEAGYPSVERTSTRPSLNILQVRAGGPSSAIPSFAEADVTARLVPDQDPAEIGGQISRYVKASTPAAVTCDVRFLSGYRPVLTSRTSAGILALSRALEETWGKKPLFDRSGAGIPVVARLQDTLGVDSVLTGFSLPADNIHGPNESVHLPTLRRGAEAMVRFLLQLSESPPGPLT